MTMCKCVCKCVHVYCEMYSRLVKKAKSSGLLCIFLKFFNFDDLQIFKGENLRSDSAKQRIALVSKDLMIHEV